MCVCVVCVSGPDQLCDASLVSSDDEVLVPSAVEHQVRDWEALRRLQDLLLDLDCRMLSAIS